jgi:SNF2 family DNA or RNA helicase
VIEVPELNISNTWVTLDEDEQNRYDMFEDQLFAEIDGQELISFSAGSKYVRCHQLANGACYDDDRSVIDFHTKKLEALSNLINELNGAPLLVAYNFKHDAARICSHIKKAVLYESGIIEKWNRGKVPILVVQYKNMARGLNLQDGGRHLACYSLTDVFDDYYQMICRLYRQGARDKTFIHRIVTRNTVDVPILNRLNRRQSVSDDFIESLKAYRFIKRKGLRVKDDLPPRI